MLARPWVNVLLAQPSVPSAGEFFCEMLGGIASPGVAAPGCPGASQPAAPRVLSLLGGAEGGEGQPPAVLQSKGWISALG